MNTYRDLCNQSQHIIKIGSKSALQGIIDGRFGGKYCIGYALEVDSSDNIISVYAVYDTNIIMENWQIKQISNKAIK